MINNPIPSEPTQSSPPPQRPATPPRPDRSQWDDLPPLIPVAADDNVDDTVIQRTITQCFKQYNRQTS